MKHYTVRQARERLRLKQEDLAAACGLDQTTISNYETGRNTNPTLAAITALARALGLKPMQLLFGDPADTKRKGMAA